MADLHLRYDSVELRMDKAERTPEGWLRVPATIGRVGVFPYRRADGSIVREARLPEDVGSEESVRSFTAVPLTNEHPAARVDASNVRMLQVGNVGTPRFEDGALRTDILITDPRAIADAESGKRQLSPGYGIELEHTPGTFNGQRYDAIQRRPRGNHVAMVNLGRQGPDVSLRMDSGDAVAHIEPHTQTTTEVRMDEITIDGKSYKVDPEVAAHLKAESQRADKAEELVAEQHEALGTAKARADKAEAEKPKLEARVDKLEADLAKSAEQSRADSATFADAVGHARLVVGPDYRCDGKDTDSVRLDVIAKIDPKSKEKLDALAQAKDPHLAAHIAARFDVAMDTWRESKNSGTKLLAAAHAASRQDSARQSAQDMLNENRQDQRQDKDAD